MEAVTDAQASPTPPHPHTYRVWLWFAFGALCVRGARVSRFPVLGYISTRLELGFKIISLTKTI